MGVASVPEYSGSSENQVVPIGLINYSQENFFLEIQGPQIVLNQKVKERISLGPIISFDFGRDAIEASNVSELPFNFNYGLNLQVKLPSFQLSDEDEFSLRLSHQKNSKAEGGAYISRWSLRYFMKLLFLLRTELEIEYRHASGEYLSFFYEEPQSGPEGFIFSQNIIFSFSEQTGTLLRYSYTKLASKVRNSPVVQDDSNLFVGLTLFYRWD